VGMCSTWIKAYWPTSAISESSAHAQNDIATHDVYIIPVLGCRKQTGDISDMTDIVGK